MFRVILFFLIIAFTGCAHIKKGCTDESHEYDVIDEVNALYPRSAYEAGIEGWATISFSIDEGGSTMDFKVIAGEPEGVFDAAVIKAAKSSKYQPRMIYCQYMEVKNVQVKYTFKFTDG